MARNEDSLLSSGRREALVVMAIWLAAAARYLCLFLDD